MHQDDAIEKKLHFNAQRDRCAAAGTQGSATSSRPSASIPALYANYRLADPSGAQLPFTGVGRIPNSEAFISFGTPAGKRISANAFYLWGHDENFFEWASSNIIIGQYGLNFRPTDRLRAEATYNLQSFNRRTDGSIVGNNRIPRLKVEYQLARPVFVRLVGEYQSLYRDALRDVGRTELPDRHVRSVRGLRVSADGRLPAEQLPRRLPVLLPAESGDGVLPRLRRRLRRCAPTRAAVRVSRAASASAATTAPTTPSS